MSNPVHGYNDNSELTISEASKILGVSTKTLRRWEASGKLKAERGSNGYRMYKMSDLQKVLASPSTQKNYIAPLAFTVIMLAVGLGLNSNYPYTTYHIPYTTEPSKPSVLAATDEGITPSVSGFTFAVNVPSKFSETVTFLKDIVAPNVVNSINNEVGDITIDNSLTAGTGISITDRTITNSGIVTLTAGDGISVDGNKITNTYSFTPDYTQGGWTKTGTTLSPTTFSDSVNIGALTADTITVDGISILNGNATIGNSYSILPDTDLGSDLGSSSYRFNNLWVANINSNSSQAFSGQTTFSYAPTDTTINQASVLINPTTAAANGQLLGLSIAGYQRALIDEDGDIILGYNSLTSAPATDYPLDIYGHSGTRVAYVDSSGIIAGSALRGDSWSAADGTAVATIQTGSSYRLNMNGRNMWNIAGFSAGGIDANFGSGNTITFATNGTERMRIQPTTGNVGIGTTSPGGKLEINTGTASTVGQIIKASSSQSANMLEIQNTSGQAMAYFNSTGGLRFISTLTNAIDTVSGGIFGAPTASNSGKGIATTTSGMSVFHWNGDVSLRPGNGDGTFTTALTAISSGNVGIGTTSPSHKLTISNGAVSSDYGILIPNSGQGIYYGTGSSYNWGFVPLIGANRLGIVAGGSEKLSINDSGNVGIGTSSPTKSLHVNNGDLRLGGSSSRADIIFTAATGLATTLNAAGRSITFQTSAVDNTPLDRLTITGDGNVGIGTTSPGAKLDVNGAIWSRSGGIYSDVYRGYTYDGNLSLNSTNVIIQSGTGDPIILSTNGSSEAMRITSSGNVGIGTTSPTSKLHVSGAVTGKALAIFDETGDQNILTASASGTTRFVVTNSGNVGIGTSSPQSALHVNGNIRTDYVNGAYLFDASGVNRGGLTYNNGSGSYVGLRLASAINDRGLYFSYGGGTGTFGIFRDAGSFNTTPILFADSSGNVGIGTSSPGNLLEIRQSAHITPATQSTYGLTVNAPGGNGSLSFGSDASYAYIQSFNAKPLQINNRGNNTLFNITGGNVGIGTSSPGEKLHVIGNGKFEGTFNVAQGYASTFTGAIAMGNNVGSDNMILQTGDGIFSVSTGTASNQLYVPAGGNVGIGTTAPGEKLEVVGNIKTSSLTTGTVYSNNGVLTNTDPSDINLKTNVLNLPDGTLNKVLGLRTVSYNWKSTGDGALGFIAQEVQDIFPELVGTNNDGSLGLYTTQFIPLLTKAIQEQQMEIDEVKSESKWQTLSDLVATLQTAINDVVEKITAMTDEFRTKKVCLGENGNETCVTKEQLDELMKLLPSPTSTPAPVVNPTTIPEGSPEVTLVPTVSPTSLPTVEPSPTSSPISE